MSQIRCYLAMTVILAFGCIIEGRSVIRTKKNNGDISTKKNNGDISTRNTPRPFDNCVYEYRTNAISHCHYGVSFGHHKPEEELIFNKVLSGRPIEFSTTKDWEINNIFVEERFPSRDIRNDGLHIITGGIGENFFKMESNSSQSIYRVFVHAIRKKTD